MLAWMALQKKQIIRKIIVEVKRQKLCLTLPYPLTESRISPLIILGWSAVWSLQQTQVWEDIHIVLWSNWAVHHKRYQARILVTFYPSSNLGLLTEFLWLESFQLQRSFLQTKCFILATSLKKVLRGKDYGYKIQIAYMVNFDLKHTHNFSRWLPFNYLSCVSTANFLLTFSGYRTSTMLNVPMNVAQKCTLSLPVADPWAQRTIPLPWPCKKKS